MAVPRCPVWCECAVLWQAGKIHIKVSLKERFSAADGDAAAPAPVTPVAECLAKKCFRGDFLRTGVFRWARNTFGKSGCAGSAGGGVREGKSLWQYPCIRIVAVAAAHETTLHEYHEADTGTVYGAEGIDGMNITGMHRYSTSWQVRAITSSCCSLVRLINLTAYPETRMVKLAYSGFSGCSIASFSFSIPKTFTFK